MDHRIELVLQEVTPDSTVLDIGCVHHAADRERDSRWLHKHLYGRCRHVIGMDILEEDCAVLRNMGYNILQGDAEVFNLGRKFDCIVAGELIEHLSNPGLFLDRCKSHLNENGKLILTTPNAWCISNIISIILRDYSPVHEQHTHWYDKITITQLLERHGYKVHNLNYIQGRNSAWSRSILSVLYALKFKQLAGEGIFIVCSPT